MLTTKKHADHVTHEIPCLMAFFSGTLYSAEVALYFKNSAKKSKL